MPSGPFGPSAMHQEGPAADRALRDVKELIASHRCLPRREGGPVMGARTGRGLLT